MADLCLLKILELEPFSETDQDPKLLLFVVTYVGEIVVLFVRKLVR